MTESANHRSPTLESLQYWAGEENPDAVQAMLETMKATGVHPELIERLEALEVRLRLQDAFKAASARLSRLDSNRPNSLRQDLSRNVQDIDVPADARQMERSIMHYLGKTRLEVIEAGTPEIDAATHLGRLQDRLSDESKQEQAVAGLRNIPSEATGWLTERSRSSLEIVTENLWESAMTGRDVAAFLEMSNQSPIDPSDCLADWRSTYTTSIRRSADELDAAVTWLTFTDNVE